MGDDKSVFDPDAARFNSYVDAMKRSRWLLLISTLLSSILLIHMYLEQFSFQERQVTGALVNRAKLGKEEEAAALKSRLHEHHIVAQKPGAQRTPADNACIIADAELNKLATEYADLRYRMARLDNYLDDLSFPPRRLPLVPIDIPANDFVPIVGVMLLVFAISNWLNVRTVHAGISSLLTDPTPAAPLNELRQLISLHFTFTGLHDHRGEGRAARGMQYAAFSLPCASMLVAFVLDVYSVIEPLLHSNAGFIGTLNDVLWSEFVILCELVFISIVTVATIVKLRDIDHDVVVR